MFLLHVLITYIVMSALSICANTITEMVEGQYELPAKSAHV